VDSGGPGLVPLLFSAVLVAKAKDKRLLSRRLKSALEKRGVMEGPGAVMEQRPHRGPQLGKHTGKTEARLVTNTKVWNLDLSYIFETLVTLGSSGSEEDLFLRASVAHP